MVSLPYRSSCFRRLLAKLEACRLHGCAQLSRFARSAMQLGGMSCNTFAAARYSGLTHRVVHGHKVTAERV